MEDETMMQAGPLCGSGGGGGGDNSGGGGNSAPKVSGAPKAPKTSIPKK